MNLHAHLNWHSGAAALNSVPCVVVRKASRDVRHLESAHSFIVAHLALARESTSDEDSVLLRVSALNGVSECAEFRPRYFGPESALRNLACQRKKSNAADVT